MGLRFIGAARKQAEEDRHVGVPAEDAEHDLAGGSDHLTGDHHERIDERLELHAEHAAFLGLVFFLPTPLGTPAASRPTTP